MSFYSISEDGNRDNLIRVVSVSFLHCKVLHFPFVISKYRVEKYLETI